MLYKLILKDGSEVFAEISECIKDNIFKYGIEGYTQLGDVLIFTIEKKAVKYNEISSVEEVKNPIEKRFFKLKPEHIRALQRLNIKSFIENVDSVNIYLDTKRPFRNSDVFKDVFEILGINSNTIDEAYEVEFVNTDIAETIRNKREKAYEEAMLFLAELPIAYKVIMYHMTFEPGYYKLPDTYEYSNVLLGYLKVKNFVTLRKSIKSIQRILFSTGFQEELNILINELFKIEFGGNKAFEIAMKMVQFQYKNKPYFVHSFARILKIFNNNAPDNQKISITKDMIMNALKKNHIEILCNCGSKKVSLKIKKEIIEFKNYDWGNILLLDQIGKDKLSDIIYKNVCELLEKDPVLYYRMYLLLN